MGQFDTAETLTAISFAETLTAILYYVSVIVGLVFSCLLVQSREL